MKTPIAQSGAEPAFAASAEVQSPRPSSPWLRPSKFIFLAKWIMIFLLSPAAAMVTKAAVLPHNFWANPAFEAGDNLDQPDGVPANWNRGGNDPSICQVITNNSVSAGHSLAVVDLGEGDLYGEWYSDLVLGENASAGDSLDIQWFEMYNLSSGEMRLTVLFFNASDNVVGQTHFVTGGDSSAGWISSIVDSTFTPRRESLSVPLGAVKMRCSLVSGGSGALTGVMVIDDLSVARAALPNLLFGNFWLNPTFEEGSDLDTTAGAVANWNRGGNTPAICQIITNNYASSGHALAVIDTAPGELYGEWYSDVSLAGNAAPGDTLSLQWFEMYNLSGPEMRLTALFFNASDSVVGETHFVTAGTTNAGWRGTIESSSFTKRTGALLVPPDATKLRFSLVSGGPETLTGVLIIDDLSVARVAPLVSGNFWVNSDFENGLDLDKTNGTPANWNRGGSDGSIDQLTTQSFASPTHSLALLDSSPTAYGEWYSDVLLDGHAVAGDRLDVKWSEAYGITNGEMRVTIGFFSGAGGFISETHFTASGNSAGWLDGVTGSPLVKRRQEVVVPTGAGKIRVALVSAGPVETVGAMIIDDLTVAPHPATVLAGNLFPNPSFEEGDQLDNPTGGSPAGIWARGGGDGSIDQITLSNSVSPSHSLSLVDNNENGYGEWYGFLTLPGGVAGNLLDFQWFQLYSVTNGNMRLTFAFTDADNNQLEGHDYNVSGQSAGWMDTVSESTFEQQNQTLLAPVGTVKLRVNLASGGSSSVTGVMLIDDLSVSINTSRPKFTVFLLAPDGFHLSWESIPGKSYTVQFSTVLGDWAAIATNLPSDGLSTSYLDSVVRDGKAGFYRVLQEQ